MVLIFIILLLLLENVVSTEAEYVGCALETNNKWYDWEPKGNPLLLHVDLKVLHMRDIPNSGGSFGIDMQYVISVV